MDIKELYYLLLHKLWLILLVGILTASIAWAYSNFVVEPLYKSSTSVYVINKKDDTKVTLSAIESAIKISKDYMIIAKSRPVTEEVIRILGLNISSDELADLVQISSPLDTGLLKISVKYNDPGYAKKIADAFTEVSIDRMIKLMDIYAINIIEKGNLSSSPISPDVKLNTVLGGVIGVIIVLFVLVYSHVVNASLRSSADIEKYLGLSTLGVLPVNTSVKKYINRGK